MTIEHDTTVTVNLDPDEAAVVLRALAHEALVQTGRGEDADHYREEARKLAAEARKLAAEVIRLEALVDALKSSVDTTRQISDEVHAESETVRVANAELTKELEVALAYMVELEDKIDRLRSDRAAGNLRRDADTLTPLGGTPADIAAHLFERSISDPGGGQ